ncbi:hypothetical protein AB0I82_29095 [Streptomyces sp. NPDC050315]|uniref:hypothetical protein n=1 Tax=Streptomyces sp. NPDC050315 TaxID=3155039 RepID=UPI00342637E7
MKPTAFTHGGTTSSTPEARAESFYRDGGAPAIMRAAHFPDELLFFLQMEGLAALDAVSRHQCDSLVELGCYDGRALEVAKAARIPYLGVDISSGAIGRLNCRIAEEGLQEQARAVLGDVLHSAEWAGEITGEHPLHLLPFNLLGNFTEPEKVIAGLSGIGGTGLISVFNEQPSTTAVRRAYYTSCGIQHIEEAPGDYGGVVFRGEGGFRSQSFSEESMNQLLDKANATVVGRTWNRLGQCVIARFC